MKIENIKLAYHRNGVSGEGFHVATFNWLDTDHSPAINRNMTAVVFEGSGRCAVFDRDMLKDANIEFGNGNSWRGDNFETLLRDAIKERG
jgi:hypothetical protein